MPQNDGAFALDSKMNLLPHPHRWGMLLDICLTRWDNAEMRLFQPFSVLVDSLAVSDDFCALNSPPSQAGFLAFRLPNIGVKSALRMLAYRNLALTGQACSLELADICRWISTSTIFRSCKQ
jgi:hypothetical protein